MTNTRLLFVHARSPLHAGTGQGTGVIDLPIALEKATGLPYLPGSSIKGTLRDSGALADDEKFAIFGPDTANAADFAGSVQFADARLLLLPVRSLGGTFAWVTSPYILRRFARDAYDVGITPLPDVPDFTPSTLFQACYVADSTVLAVPGVGKVVLEDLDLAIQPNDAVAMWATTLGNWLFAGDADAAYWQQALQERLCVVSNEVFGFLLTTATEIVARIKLQDNSKTVQQGQLWYEESLPSEAVLASIVVVNPVRTDKRKQLDVAHIISALEDLIKPTLQFGGKATVGRGLCRVRLIGKG